ncbi:penaeidin-2b-like [Penaeus chinensis]|uniref:penaeidin-2b-like n=1 Tax=Penaeus chinensis TaxID=139456 RepID=UPI001FB82D70|nr:penaeidin-2b-like [Penaeus chinensis]
MRLVVCLVFLASFALVCRGQGYKSGHTGPYPRPLYGGSFGPIRPEIRLIKPGPLCNICRTVSIATVEYCCGRYGRCCHELKR